MSWKQFAIRDPSAGGRQVAALFYDAGSKQFRISIDKSADISKLPISLKIHAEQGRYDLDGSFSMDWVRARICPPYRHNISGILQELGLQEYDEFDLIMRTEGKSLMDDLYLTI